jgi:hypothetical protein
MSVRIGQEGSGDVRRAQIAVVASRPTIFTLVLVDLYSSEAACAVDEPRIAMKMCTIRQ